MELDGLAIVAAVFGSVSAAAERFVVIVKLIFKGLADPMMDDARNTTLKSAVGDRLTKAQRSERLRQFLVQMVAFFGGWLAAAFWADGGRFDPCGTFSFKIGTELHTLSVATLGLFGVAGSAFWSSVVGFVTAAKDVGRMRAAQ